MAVVDDGGLLHIDVESLKQYKARLRGLVEKNQRKKVGQGGGLV